MTYPDYKTFPKVLVVGDVMLDNYFFGNVKRISPEAPIPILHLKNKEMRLGGAANVAKNIKKLGATVLLLGAIGRDEPGETIKELLKQENVKNKLIKIKNYSTVQKSRYMCRGQQLLRVDEEESNSSISDMIMPIFQRVLVNFDVVVFSDYNKGLLFHCNKLIKIAKSKNKFTIVDPKVDSWSRYFGADLIKPNRDEFLSAAKFIDFHNKKEVNISRKLKKTYSIPNIVLTKSELGMTLYSKKIFCASKISTEKNNVSDVTGAGDTVIAVLAIFFQLIKEKKKVIDLANTAATISVGKIGVYAVSLEEICKYEANLLFRSASSKKLSYGDKKKQVKSSNCVFTNGCFDIIHRGHIDFLKECSLLGERLVVGLNSDTSVKSLKGRNRPIMGQEDRKEILLSMSLIDDVIIFDEVTPLRLIKDLNPSVLVKGSDYEIDEIVGAAYVKKQGGLVKTVQIREGYSTTKLIKKIKKE